MEEKKKRQKTGGRVKGTPNKTTTITRDVISSIASGIREQIEDDLKKLTPKDRVAAFLKMCEFNIPKPQSISLDMTVEGKKTIEDRLRELADDEE